MCVHTVINNRSVCVSSTRSDRPALVHVISQLCWAHLHQILRWYQAISSRILCCNGIWHLYVPGACSHTHTHTHTWTSLFPTQDASRIQLPYSCSYRLIHYFQRSSLFCIIKRILSFRSCDYYKIHVVYFDIWVSWAVCGSMWSCEGGIPHSKTSAPSVCRAFIKYT